MEGYTIQVLRRMNNKKKSCKIDGVIEPNSQHVNHLDPKNSLTKSLAQFKLDRIFPRNINMKLNIETKETADINQPQAVGKSSNHFVRLSCSPQNKLYQEYINLKEEQVKNRVKRNKIAHIFNIRSINLIDKIKYDQQRAEYQPSKLREKYTSKNHKRTITEKTQKDNFKPTLLLFIQKKTPSPDFSKNILGDKKNCTPMQKFVQNKPLTLQKSSDSFELKMNEYHQYLKEHCQCHRIMLKQIENYTKNSILFSVGRGNNGNLIKQILKKRWWWNMVEDKSKKQANFSWTQLKQKSYYVKQQKRSISIVSQPKRSQSPGKNRNSLKQHTNQQLLQVSEAQIHNHFQNNEFLGNKKALYYNMKVFYERQNKNVFDYLPVTFHVKRYGDQIWNEFSKYYFEDAKRFEGQKRLWIIKPGENTNRGKGITIHSDYDKIKQWVESEISGQNNIKKTFIIQKYIDKPFLYNKRKFDIRCYMLLVRLNGAIKGYWYNEGYIRTSCYEYQLQDTDNEFIHLTNDAIQVNSQKYGKYEDGNKLSYHNFQKYLDNTLKSSYNFVQDICPKLKEIGTDSIEASYHLLGSWNGLPTFQIFGLDFMIDENFKPWLIEINTNPCLQTSSTTLQRVIPRMVDNAFKLSLDLLFPAPLNWPNSKKHYMPNRVSNNLFELIFDESKKNHISGLKIDEIIIEMGEVEEDNQVYEEKGQKEANSSEIVYASIQNE